MVENLVIAVVAVVVVGVAIVAGRIARARSGATQAPPGDKSEALFVSMFPDLQPHFHPGNLVAYVLARRGRTPARGGFTWKAAPGFGGPAVDIRFVKDREECTLVDAEGRRLAAFRFEPQADGAILRVGPGKFTVDLKNPGDPAVRYWHPEREFKWTRRSGWRFKTPVAERPFDSSDRGTSWSDTSSSSSDGLRTSAAAAGVAGLGGTFDGGGASAAWEGGPADAAPAGSDSGAMVGPDSGSDSGSDSDAGAGSDSGSTSY
jgi:hypothetical protein